MLYLSPAYHKSSHTLTYTLLEYTPSFKGCVAVGILGGRWLYATMFEKPMYSAGTTARGSACVLPLDSARQSASDDMLDDSCYRPSRLYAPRLNKTSNISGTTTRSNERTPPSDLHCKTVLDDVLNDPWCSMGGSEMRWLAAAADGALRPNRLESSPVRSTIVIAEVGSPYVPVDRTTGRRNGSGQSNHRDIVPWQSRAFSSAAEARSRGKPGRSAVRESNGSSGARVRPSEAPGCLGTGCAISNFVPSPHGPQQINEIRTLRDSEKHRRPRVVR